MGRFQGDLPERTYQFARVIVRIVRAMPPGNEAWVIGRQLLKSGTAIGSNVSEADMALTKREFTSFCNIARREANETRYWLRLCRDEQILDDEAASPAIATAEEFQRILATIVRKTRSEDG